MTSWEDRLARWKAEVELFAQLDDLPWVPLAVAEAEAGASRSALPPSYRSRPLGPALLVPERPAAVAAGRRAERTRAPGSARRGRRAGVPLSAHPAPGRAGRQPRGPGRPPVPPPRPARAPPGQARARGL